MPPVHLLVNPRAHGGRAARAAATLAAAIEARGHQVIPLTVSLPIETGASTTASGGPSETATATATAVGAAVTAAITAARSAASTGGGEPMTRLIVAGGDGLIHHSLAALADTGIAVGIVPSGTGNDFARALGLPTRLDAAVATALGPATPLDLIATDDGRYAASVVTGGFSGQVNQRANRLRFPPGQQRYTVATLLELPRLHPVTLKVELDGVISEHLSSLFAIANTRFFGGGMAICPTATPDDGLLDLTIVGPTSRATLARVLPTVFSGRHVNHPSVTTLRGRTVRITTPAALWADGEPFGGSTLTAAPGALQVAR